MKRRRLPLWRWDPFLAALVLVLSLVAALFQRLDIPVVSPHRHRASVEATVARVGTDVIAVLVPDATAWLGRDLRVAVDAMAGSTLYRLGYLPREIDQQVAAALRPLAARGVYRTVAVAIREVRVAPRPSPFSTRDVPAEARRQHYRLDVLLGPTVGEYTPGD